MPFFFKNQQDLLIKEILTVRPDLAGQSAQNIINNYLGTTIQAYYSTLDPQDIEMILTSEKLPPLPELLRKVLIYKHQFAEQGLHPFHFYLSTCMAKEFSEGTKKLRDHLKESERQLHYQVQEHIRLYQQINRLTGYSNLTSIDNRLN
ncbi:hypothetical protein ACFPMF_11215 [Larkinella bovis]|uniref:Uncharacterized protein n=1 Tax=Larkinella bovis TaxID=683041 RepID=A0ABW0IBF6_9BACT